jgi:hypothetical protein
MAALAPLGTDAIPTASRDQQKTASSKCSSSYEVADAAFNSIVDPSQPVRVVAEREHEFAHEASVYLEKLNKVSLTLQAGSLLQRLTMPRNAQLQEKPLAAKGPLPVLAPALQATHCTPMCNPCMGHDKNNS